MLGGLTMSARTIARQSDGDPAWAELTAGLQRWVEQGGRLRVCLTHLGESVPNISGTDGQRLPVQADVQPAGPDALIVPQAVVAEPQRVGSGSRIWHFSHVRESAVIGPDCTVGQGVYVDAGSIIGARCKLQNGVNVYRGVVLGDNVFVGPGATFTNDRYPRAAGDWQLEPTLIGEGASIGARATVVCGAHIGSYAMIGAGAVVTAPVPPHALMLGVPARLAGYVCACGRPARRHDDGTVICAEGGDAPCRARLAPAE